MKRILSVVVSLAVAVGVVVAASGCNSLSGNSKSGQGDSQKSQTHSGHQGHH